MDTSFFDVFRKRIEIRILEIFMCSDPLVDDGLRYIWIRLRADGMVLDACQFDANDWLLTLKPLVSLRPNRLLSHLRRQQARLWSENRTHELL
ncbi:hypothetical protein BpHYR1_007201 [Brachionus plicatilis]|uniref:Uncharacterized protein n=1 Tax=Brachionus plicatilis TaxID=10195 RepID=A0A3M7QYA6_BRAPC|nr:hypothetical protein BpHYR1_007201 [Brachionus plicatilis]